MGNIHVKDFFNNPENCNKNASYLQNFFSSQLLSHNQYLSDQWVLLNVEKTKDGANLFDWSNVQTSSLSGEQVEEKLRLQDFKEKLLVGQLPKQAIEDLLNPSFYDEAQSIYSPFNVVSFKDHQNHIFLLLYNAFYLMQTRRKAEVSSLTAIKTALNAANIPKAAEVGIRSGIHLIISLLKEVSQLSPNLRNETLDFLIELFAEVKPLSLWGTNKIDIILDKSLHTVADFLEEIITLESTSEDGKRKALKVLFSLGILRGSLPNLLSVVNLLRKQNIQADLVNEIKMLKNEKPKSQFDFEKRLNTQSKIYFKSCLPSDAPAPEKSPNASITTDSKYIYLHSEIEGLMKIGTGYGYTMLGKVYVHKPDYRLKERSSLAYIHGCLYYRSSRIAPSPLILLSIETLEEISTIPLNFDNQVPNCLFAEMTAPDIEFPHPPIDQEAKSKAKDLTETGAQIKKPVETTQTQTAAVAKRDIRLMRPSQRSPIFTEGRYLYVISQWTVEARTRTNEEEDEEEEGNEGTNSDLRQAKYGVDIYDPLSDFEHLRSVELVDSLNTIKDPTTGKIKQKPAINIKCLDQASFATNGSELVISIPPNVEEGSEIKYKYFNLKDGKLQRVNIIKEPYYFTNLCYDWSNNVVYGINDTKKTFDSMACYLNVTIPDRYQYNEDSEHYQPYENEKIVEIALDGLGFTDGEGDRNKEKQDKLKEDWQTLLNLGFTNKDYPGLNLTEFGSLSLNNDQKEQASKAMQLFILSNISRLADYYSNLSHLRPKTQIDSNTSIENLRRPYCVSLLPKVFEYLQQSLEHYSKTLFKKEQEDSLSIYDQCSFLCTLRIIKYNLANAEGLSAYLKKMNILLPKKEFTLLLRKLVNECLEKTNEISSSEDVNKAIYQEILAILRYNLSFIYDDDMELILKELHNSLEKIDRKPQRDIVLSIFGWLKENTHIMALVTELLNETNQKREDLVQQLSKLIDFVSSCEVKAFCKYVSSIENFENFPVFVPDEFLEEAMSFLLEFQKEVLYQVGQKVQDKTLEMSPIFILASNLTEIVTRNAVSINEAFEYKIKELSKQVEISLIPMEEKKEFEEIPMKKEKETKGDKKKTDEELRTEKNNKIWETLTTIFNYKIFFSQVLTMQVNTLSLLASNFLIASKTLKHISFFLNSLNSLYAARKEIHSANLEKVNTYLKEKSESFESEHPPPVKIDKKEKINIPGAKTLRIVFDPNCDLKRNCDYLQFFIDDKYKEKLTEKLDKTGELSSFPKEDLMVEGDTVYYLFHSDNCRTTQWGYKFTVYASIQDIQESDWMAGFHRTTCWLASKCAAQLINGSALQQAMLQDEEQRYNSLLNSKLFSGGMEKCYFSGGKEAIWIQLSDIINEFEAGFLNEYLTSSISPEEKAEEELLNHIIAGNTNERVSKVLDFIHKQFSKECLWASLGGENGGKIVRAAFAVIIKHAGLLEQFEETVENIDEIVAKGVVDPIMKNFIKKWLAASRMRTWLVEKRKEIDDMAERNRQNAIAVSSKVVSKAIAAPAKAAEKKKLTKNSKLRKKKEKDNEITFQDTKPQEAPEEESQPQAQLQVRDSEEIIQRMIEQIVKKAQFLIQLIPAKHWTQDQIEKKEKQFLFRATSEVEELSNKEEEWKRRLMQWKSVRQSKGVFKSLEDESLEIHTSLTSSVLQCLQSPVSIRRLRKQVESSYLRAICRTIGLNALTQILLGCKGSLFRQDIVGWLCTALRGNENKLYHFTDNLQGCGYFLESSINTAFKNLIQAAVKSMIKSDWADEIKCMLEALKWKYHGDDHSFLSEIDLFGILRGSDAKSLLRRAWGRSMENSLEVYFSAVKNISQKKVDNALVKKLLELFEIIVILCVGKLQSKHNSNLAEALSIGGQSIAKKDKMPILEKHVSQIDEYSAEILIRQAFFVVFTEFKEADENYKKFSGLDWGAWLRTKHRKEKKEENEKKKKKGKAVPVPGEEEEEYGEEMDEGNEERQRDDSYGSEGFPPRPARSPREEIKEEDITDEELLDELEVEEEKVEAEIEEEEKIYDENSAEEIIEEKPKNKIKTKGKEKEKEKVDDETNDDKRKKQVEKMKDTILKEERTLLELMNQLYNPEFLYRLLQLLYKCTALSLDQVSIVIGNPKYLSILYSLLRSCPPHHKILIIKILATILQTLPIELFIDSIQEYLKNNETKYNEVMLQDKEKKLSSNLLLIDFLMRVLYDIRKRSFTENIDYPDDYPVSCELITMFRVLMSQSIWSSSLSEYLNNYLLTSSDQLHQILAISILGGEINGLRYAAKIHISSTNLDELFNDNVLLKHNLEESKETATIVGFSDNYKEKVSEEDRKKLKPNEDPRFNVRLNIGSCQENMNPVALIHSSLAKEITNLATIELSTVNRFNVFAIDEKEFESTRYIIPNELFSLYEWALDTTKSGEVIESKQVYLKALLIKSFVNNISSNPSLISQIIKEKQNLITNLINYANQKVITSDNLMNLELTEEKLNRLLAASAESELDLSDLKNLSVTIKNYELELQLGRDFCNRKFPIHSGYNLEKITQYYEVLPLKEARTLDKKTLGNKAILLSSSEYNEENSEFICGSKIVITCGLDLQKFAEQIEGSKKGRIPLKKKKSLKEEIKIKKSRSQRGSISDKSKLLPYCLINVSERYFNELINEYDIQKTKPFKNIYHEKRLIDELVDFGFPKEIVEEYFVENGKSTVEVMINEISKIIEQKEDEKNKLGGVEEIQITENIEKVVSEEELPIEKTTNTDLNEIMLEEIEKEEANTCFKCKGEKEQLSIAEEKNRLYDSSIDFEGSNRIGKLIMFKQANHNLAIYYARRAVLTLLEEWPENEENWLLQDTELLLRFIKLSSFEAIFSSAILCNNLLINRIKKLLMKFFQKSDSNTQIRGFLDLLLQKCVFEPLSELENRYLNTSKDKKISTSTFTGRLNNESEIDSPFLDLSLWLAYIYFSSNIEQVSSKLLRLDILYTIIGLLTVIRQNKSLGWGMIVFCLDHLDFLKKNLVALAEKDSSLQALFNQENVLRVHNYLYNLRAREKVEAHSRKTQMLTEILLNINLLYRGLEKKASENSLIKPPKKISESRLDLDKFKLIDNITDVVEMMENYQENKILLASTWLQTSTELVKKEQKNIDGDHFYYKNLHTYKISMPFTTESTIKFSEDSQTDLGDSIIFSADSKGEHSIQKIGGNLSKKSIVFPAGSFYVHFPAKGSDIYTFGVNDNAQLGNGDTNGNGPFCLEQFSSANVLTIDSNDTQTMILTKNGELHSCGSGSQTGISSGSTRILTKVSTKEKVRLVSCGSNFSIFCTENNELFGVGSNTDGRFGLNWNNGTASPQKIEFSFGKIVKQISCGANHSLVLTNEGQVYCTGSNEHGQLGLVDENGNKSANVNTFKSNSELSKKKTLQVCAGMYFSLILVTEKDQKNTYVMSCGEKASGKLGLGNDSANTVNSYTIINELKGIDVKYLYAKKKHCLALTSNGKLYSWGLNEHGQLGLGNFENEFKPKLITFFENYKVISAGAGNHHSIVIAKAKNEEQSRVYSFGENINNKLCLKQGKEKNSTPQHVEFFDEKAPFVVLVGSNHSVILTENMKIPKFRDQHKVSCNVCSQNPIIGARFVDSQSENILNYCEICFNSLKDRPILSICVKDGMNAIKEYNWPNLKDNIQMLESNFTNEKQEFLGTSCRNCKVSPITNICYQSIHEKETNLNLCQICINEFLENEVSSTLYYRLERPIKSKEYLPIFSRNYFFLNSDTYGYNITITPKFSEKGHDYMIEKYNENYKTFSEDFKDIKPEMDEQIVDLINNIAQKKEKNTFELDDNLTFPKEELSIRTAIDKCTTDFLRKRFLILKNFNSRVKTILPFIDFSAQKDQNRLRNIYSNASIYIFWDVKSDLFEKILLQDAKAGANTKIKVNRMKANKFIQKGKPDHTGEFTVFGQIFQFFKNTGYSSFRCTKETNPFSVQFVGEAAIDVGGPYREAISQMCTELQSGALPLLIPSPNQKNDSGQFREKWVLNPSANTIIHMKMFEFLGVVMGCSIRTKNFLNLDLPSIVWKQLVDSPVNRKDLENIDRYTIQCLDDVISIQKKGVDSNTFNDLIQEKFVTYLSDGSEVELIQGGKLILVTFEKRVEYAALVEKVRLAESKKQIEAIRRGLSQIIPEGLLNLLTWREIETMVCGKPILDVELLRQNTVYRGCSEMDSVIEFFWKALTEYSPEERSMYLRFVWGRSRLPLTSKDFPMKHQIEILRKAGNEPDIMLPVAHTCFFSIELPRYSSYEILRDKLKYAFTNCQAIDTDGRAYDIWEDED